MYFEIPSKEYDWSLACLYLTQESCLSNPLHSTGKHGHTSTHTHLKTLYLCYPPPLCPGHPTGLLKGCMVSNLENPARHTSPSEKNEKVGLPVVGSAHPSGMHLAWTRIGLPVWVLQRHPHDAFHSPCVMAPFQWAQSKYFMGKLAKNMKHFHIFSKYILSSKHIRHLPTDMLFQLLHHLKSKYLNQLNLLQLSI